MDRVHLHKGRKLQHLEIAVSTPGKNSTVGDLRVMAFPGFELHFALQVDVPCGKETLADVGVERSYGHAELRMVCDDLIGRLPLSDERGDDAVLRVELLSGEADPCP